MQKKLTLIFVGLMIVGLLAACVPTAAPAAAKTPTRSMNISGTGEVSLVPDIARVNIGVHTEADLVADALNSNTAQANEISNALKSMGVEEKDVQTSNFNVYPANRYDPMTGEVTSTYFVVDNTVTVIIRDLSKLGEALTAVVNAGANNINGINFDVEDRDAAVAQAREQAIQNAKAKALEIADAAGVELGDLLSINVYGGSNYYPTYYDGKGGGYAEASVPVSAGTLTITMECNLTYELK